MKLEAYYKYVYSSDKRKLVQKQIINIVKKRRKSLPIEDVRKLMTSLKQDFVNSHVKVGRGTLFNVLREHQMLTLRKNSNSRTTNSHHRFYKYNNFIKDLKITRPNQV
ncbi:hypothetical protein [Bizionia myxarmorum]|uniref:Transposase n=1 Tax=Bizionia myxarmorum TaxID=291186 RepID=A0A5D0R4Q0_9FLAO|nr:hypothetical protein [Bizionia myxarmorum]TYB75905.1 hypothetical protein ES674_13915 [Bizionia myxarmorum]